MTPADLRAATRRAIETPDLPNIGYYNYSLPWPHAGAGVRVEF